ncbi:MAG: VWA-like domain-containing protein [Alphaproteobacteria bacterium]
MLEKDRKLTRARFALMRDHPFFATILLQLDLVANGRVETIETDGRQIRYAPSWLAEISERHLQAVLAHNVMHIAFEHPLRLQDHDPALANRAMDLAINPLLQEAGFDLPDDAPIDPAFADMPWERIYALLEQRQSENGGGNGQQDPAGGGAGASGGQPSSGEPQAGDGGSDPSSWQHPSCGRVEAPTGDDDRPASPAEMRAAANQMRVLVVQAAQTARCAGKLDSGLERLVRQQLAPTTDWRAVLRRFVRERAQDGYSWSRPNRRHAWRGVILPSAWSQRLGEIVVAIDTSASIREHELAAFAAEAKAIFAEVKPAAVNVLQCDTKVTSSRRFTELDQLELCAKGGGGTCFQPAFDWVDTKAEQPPACLLYFTDLDPADQPADPGYPVLWVATSDRKPPSFGEVVRLQTL